MTEETINKVSEWVEDGTNEGTYYLDGECRDHKTLDGTYYDVDCFASETDAKYFPLTLPEKKELNNGWRYIKEMIMQCHNFKMYENSNKLLNAGVKVAPIKTDASVIDKHNLQKIKKGLKVSQGKLEVL